MSGGKLRAPADYSEIDYQEQDSQLRQALHGHWRDWGESFRVSDDNRRRASYGCDGTRKATEAINGDQRLTFTGDCSDRVSTFEEARGLRDVLHVPGDYDESSKNGLRAAGDPGLPYLQSAATRIHGDKLRAGICPSSNSDDRSNAICGLDANTIGVVATQAEILGRKWRLADYGDTIAGYVAGPINDVCGRRLNGRNQRLSIQLASGHIAPRDGGARANRPRASYSREGV